MGHFRVITPNPNHPSELRNRALAAERALRAAEMELRSRPASFSSDALVDLLSARSASGATVNATTALGVPGFFACVSLLSNLVATLPVDLVRTTERGDEPVRNHPAAHVAKRPGDLHTSFELRQLAMTGVCLGGNGYIRVHRDGVGDPVELEWLAPSSVRPFRPSGQRFICYQVQGESVPLTRYDIIHVRALTTDGIAGRAPVSILRESIGTSMSQRDAAARMVRNGSTFNGLIKVPASLDETKVKRVRDEWRRSQEGPENAGKVPILWGGSEWMTVGGMSAVDLDLIENRRFDLHEIGRVFQIHPVLLGDPTATPPGGGIEQLNLMLLSYCLNPWLVNWEQALDYSLLTTDELRSGLHFVFDREQIAAVGLQAMAAFISTMRTTGVFSPNAALAWLGYPKSDAPGMDDARAPLNSSSTGSAPAVAPASDAQPQPALA